MNFFGHAVVASWRSSSCPFVLGAMLPDFATMIGARVPSVSHPELAAGIGFHHETDRVFHQTSTFLDLQRKARQELRARGLRRGSALAVAHVGVEILLDACLANETIARATYLDALDAGGSDGLARDIAWTGSETSRYETLRAALVSRGVSPGHVEADAVAHRLERALSGRPRLALEPDDVAKVRGWAEETAPEVERRSRTLVREVRSGLGLATM